MAQVQCNRCKAPFVSKPETRSVGDNIKEVYFICPVCQAYYHSYYTNVIIENKQAKQARLKEEYDQLRGRNPRKAEQKFSQYKKLKKEIGREMEKLERFIKRGKRREGGQ